jgi:flagellar biosynthetic protein FliQ
VSHVQDAVFWLTAAGAGLWHGETGPKRAVGRKTGMNATDVVEVLRDALLITAIVSGPFLIIGMVVGLVVSLVQAMTQLQEATLTFVPKVIVIGIIMILFGPFAINRLIDFTQSLMDRAISLGIQ